MDKIAMFLFFIGCCSIMNGQSISDQKELMEAFDVFINGFKDDRKRELEFLRKEGEDFDSTDYIIKLPVLWESNVGREKEKMITVEISDSPIAMKVRETVLENPYGSGFPVSYSVIYRDRLVSLFESGQFVCHTIPSMQRDLLFEEKINKKKFDYHWVIGDKLLGISQEKYYYLDSNDKWATYRENIPLINQPKLFEDASFISFCDCAGEFGGTVYFYNKATQKITFTNATCANTVYLKDGKYYVLSELGHMMGRSTLKEISNPDQLPMIDIETSRKHPRDIEAKAVGYSDKSNASSTVFSFFQILLQSTFNYKGRAVYLAYLNHLDRSFLAEVENNAIKVINPLLNNKLIVHYPVTTSYSNAILINGAFYRIGREREVSCIIIKDDEFIMIDWNEKYR